MVPTRTRDPEPDGGVEPLRRRVPLQEAVRAGVHRGAVLGVAVLSASGGLRRLGGRGHPSPPAKSGRESLARRVRRRNGIGASVCGGRRQAGGSRSAP